LFTVVFSTANKSFVADLFTLNRGAKRKYMSTAARSQNLTPKRALTGKLLLQSICVMLALVLPAQQAFAISLIRDAETERFIRVISEPIFISAGLNPRAVNTYLINASSINAFVTGGQNVFMHTGTLQQAETPNEVLGVMAHETGHITGGHLSGRREAFENAAAPAIVGYLLGIGAIVAGAGDVGLALITGGQTVAQRGLLAYTRTQEASADQAALDFLERTGQSGMGLVSFFDKLADQEALSERSQDPYVRTHPLSRERIATLQNRVDQSPFRDVKDPEEWQRMLDMVKAKLHGFIDRPQVTFRRYPESDQSAPARYARAIAYYKIPNTDRAIAEIDALIADYPDNAYFQEFKGQALFESGRSAEAVEAYTAADRLLPNQPLLMVGLGQALVGTGDKANITRAREILERATQIERDYPTAFRILAQAYADEGNQPMAALATAEQNVASGRLPDAKQWASRAKRGLPVGSPAWQRADDISRIENPDI
jgi:predicted Zn-dependent protease